ncbi:tRNA epoxyqueuosine(34) reductase QueG [Pontixanthobacter aquaemixtae]|uniref:Epoxyqueuosine reductase n=1 Tax=Pontixanthobacter aquaemixtae TaxID=1958940 RepID=A0A844ZU95_9SPHN|nr:tRNA epoxyqueuosine(34) reductase QueG [Pontixanthobacter aquaemixtae]MXO91543.1 tRNA epoxyqueuosine(34) reductase QueG [Pontixanthobacter aquaemixtae]
MVNAPVIVGLKHRLIAEAQRLGFASVGFTSAADDPQRSQRLHAWIEAGHHGSMEWMADRADVRQGPHSMWPEAQSVIALGMSYAPEIDPLALEEHPDKARISVYAQGRDYHDTVKKALKALARWLVAEAKKEGLEEPQLKVFVDTAPVMEKPLGEASGIGWQGKHSNLVSREHGSWLFLGAIYTTVPFEPDAPHRDQCGSCTACHDACPTDAFPQPYVVDARRCISYLTIEHKGPIPSEFRKAMGNRIYGCDDCLAVCPWNKFADSAARHKAFVPRDELIEPRLSDFLDLDDAAFRALFSGSPIKRIGRDRFVRNCLIAAGNSGDTGLLGQVEALQSDADPAVAEAADWAKAELTAAL